MIVIFSSTDSSPPAAMLKEQMLLEEQGIEYLVVDYTALKQGDLVGALRRVRQLTQKVGLYRGWILHPHEYQQLYDGLSERGVRLITAPQQYCQAQFLPEFYPHVADVSFPAVWSASCDAEEIQRLAIALGPPPYFLKDYAKSAKEIWPRGCVVEPPGSIDQFREAIDALVEFRGDRFEGGIVVRPLLRLHRLGDNPFGDPVYEEYRMIFVGGRRIATHGYDYVRGTVTDFSRFDILGQRIDSPFFTADCVVTEKGNCLLLETNDGGSASMPPGIDLRALYASLIAVASECGSS